MKAGQSNLTKHLKTTKSVERIFNQAQAAFNAWSKLDPETRTAKAILDAQILTFLNCLIASLSLAHESTSQHSTTQQILAISLNVTSQSPFHCPLTTRSDVVSLNEIFEQLKLLKLSVYAPVSYILPSRLKKYEEMYDTQVEGGR